jgi:hypothetical protein
MTVMLEDRIVKPQFEHSKLILPAENRIWTPKDWDGSTVVHAPLKPSLDNLHQEIETFLRKKRGLPPLLGGAAAGAWTFTNASRTNMLNGTHDFDTDTFLTALFLSTSNIGAASTTYAGVTNEHANGNGYTTGGISMGALTLSGTTTVTVDDPADMVWTASGGSIVARFGVLYESGGQVVAYFLLESTGPADVTATSGNTLTIALHASGIFTLA